MRLLDHKTTLISCPALPDDLHRLREHDKEDENKHSLQCVQQLKEDARVVLRVETDHLRDEAQRLDDEQETRGPCSAEEKN